MQMKVYESAADLFARSQFQCAPDGGRGPDHLGACDGEQTFYVERQYGLVFYN